MSFRRCWYFSPGAVFPVPVFDETGLRHAGSHAVATNTSIVAKYYGADYQYAAMLTVITTCRPS